MLRQTVPLILFCLSYLGSLGESPRGGCQLYNAVNLSDVDVVIYISHSIPPRGPEALSPVMEDLNEACSIHPLFTSGHNVYTPRHAPPRVKRVIFAPIKLTECLDCALEVYDSATKAATLAFLGAFDKGNENILLVIGPELFDSSILWRTKDKAELNAILGFLYPLYDPLDGTQRYRRLYVYNVSTDVVKMSESIENGRRSARALARKRHPSWNAERLFSSLQSTFNDSVIKLSAASERIPPSASPPKTVYHLRYDPGEVKGVVHLISTNSTKHGLFTIVGFFKILQHLQPKGTEFRASIGCFTNGQKFLAKLHNDSMDEVLGVAIPKANADVFVIGAHRGDADRRDLDYYGQKYDYEFGPVAESDGVDDFVKKSADGEDTRKVYFLGNSDGFSSRLQSYSLHLTSLVSHYLLKRDVQ